MEPVYWISDAPTKCEIRGLPITDTFVDGLSLPHGGWALMHPSTFAELGSGFGTGRGQKYTKQADGRWLKTEG